MQTEKIHEIISEKYDKLIWSIARKISGDVATSSLEDNYADLWLAAFEAVEGFTKQNDYANGPIEDWIETRPFDKYLKTCLWNKKNHKGKQIANKYHIHRDTVPTHLEEVLNVSDSSHCWITDRGFSKKLSNASAFVRNEESRPLDVGVLLSERESVVVAALLYDPSKYLTEGGKLKILPIQKYLGWTRRKVVDAIAGINKKMNSSECRGI
tara:strand:- start:367 stop:999 length:633 start_codon:yes stop_codon:yes gene_type:complete